jgi:DNA repair exonuclease SbcCD ATPase subunit
MAKQLIPEELNELIQEYLTDGVLTDKERQVILRKAESMGLDRDEIDLYLDAQVQKIDQQTDAAVRKQKGKQCPFCGAPVPQLADKCPECGQYITPEASEELKEIIDNLEEALIDFKSGKDLAKSKATVERFARKAKMYYSNNPKIKPLLAEIETEMADAENKAKVQARKATASKVLSNKLIWGILAIIVGIVLLVLGFNDGYNPEKYGIALGELAGGAIFVGVGIYLFNSNNKK